MNYIGFDNKGNKLNIGDICKFKLDKKEYEGMIMYDQEVFAFVFEMEDDNFPCVMMNKADLYSIEKIIGIYSTNKNDEFGFYREIFKKMLNS